MLLVGMTGAIKAQKMNVIPTIKLNNGIEMPQLGIGTFAVKEDAAERVCHAVKTGFRLIDTAQGMAMKKKWAKASVKVASTASCFSLQPK